MDHLDITYLNISVLESMQKMYYFSCQNNLLTSPLHVPQMPVLSQFIMRSNGLTQVPDMYHLKKLKKVTFSRNPINTVNTIFPESLQNAYIKYANIKYFGPQVLSKCTSLRKIYLTYSNLQSMPHLGNLSSAFKLALLRSNQITTLDESSLAGLISGDIILKDNPILCDTSICWVLRRTLPYTLQFTCHSPQALQGKSISALSFSNLKCPGRYITYNMNICGMSMSIVMSLTVCSNSPMPL